MSDATILTAFLRRRRLDLGLTLRDVGDRCGVPLQSIHVWETQGARMRIDRLVIWADALGCDLELTVRPAPLRTRFDSLDELLQDARDNAWARRVATPATPDDIEEIKRRLAEYETAKENPK